MVNPRTGAELWRKGGQAGRVDFTDEEVNSMQAMILTHNHPGSSSLSPEDVGLAMRADMQSIRAVGALGWRYSIERPAEGWPRPVADARGKLRALLLKDGRVVDVQRFDMELTAEIRSWLIPKLATISKAEGDAEMDRLQLVHWHQIWERVSLDIDLGYKREEWQP